MKIKILYIPLLVLLIATLSGAGTYLYQESRIRTVRNEFEKDKRELQDQIQVLKGKDELITYTNKDLKFSIEYPKQWSIEKISSNVIQFFSPSTDPGFFAVQVEDNTSKISVEEWVEKNTDFSLKCGQEIFVADGLKGIRFFGNNMGVPYAEVYFGTQDKIYRIDSASYFGPLFENILYSFKVVE